MTLFEVSLPEHHNAEEDRVELKTLLSTMEQFYAGMQTVGSPKAPSRYTLEIAVSNKQDHIIFYTAVPTQFINLFEKQILSLFPTAVLTEQRNDYNIFVEDGMSLVSTAKLEKHNKSTETIALTTGETYALARAQGYQAATEHPALPASRLLGVERPVDVVVMAA